MIKSSIECINRHPGMVKREKDSKEMKFNGKRNTFLPAIAEDLSRTCANNAESIAIASFFYLLVGTATLNDPSSYSRSSIRNHVHAKAEASRQMLQAGEAEVGGNEEG